MKIKQVGHIINPITSFGYLEDQAIIEASVADQGTWLAMQARRFHRRNHFSCITVLLVHC